MKKKFMTILTSGLVESEHQIPNSKSAMSISISIFKF
jgi:hypothetical protein